MSSGQLSVVAAGGILAALLAYVKQTHPSLPSSSSSSSSGPRKAGDTEKGASAALPTASQWTNTHTHPNEFSFPPLKNDLILRAALSQPTERVPVWMHRQAGRYLPEFRQVRQQHDFFTICRTPKLACEITVQPVRRLAVDAAIVFSDILVIPQVLGIEVVMETAKGPVVTNPLTSPQDLSRLRPYSDINVYRDLGYVFDAITLARKELDGKVPIIGFAGAPWTILAYIVEGGHAKSLIDGKRWLYNHPLSSHEILQLVTDVTVDYLIGQVQAGAQMLEVFESDAGELGPSAFEEFCLPYLKAIATRVKAGLRARNIPTVPMTVFPRGAHYSLEMLRDSEYDVIALDWTIDPVKARAQVQGKKALQGNLEPAALFASKDQIRELTGRMVESFGTQNYIANLGWGMLPNHSPDAAAAFVDAVHEHSEAINARGGASKL